MHNKEFWLKVQKEYLEWLELESTIKDQYAIHICSGSKTFDEYYSQSSITEQEPLREAARKFLNQSKYKKTKIGYVSLFSIVGKTKENNIEIRKDFLNFMINYAND
jgi:hypothetical protein